MCHMNLIHTSEPYFSNIHFNINQPTIPRSPKQVLLFRFSNQNLRFKCFLLILLHTIYIHLKLRVNPLCALVVISTYLMEYSENMESIGGSQCTSTELLVTFSIVRFRGGCGTETCREIYSTKC